MKTREAARIVLRPGMRGVGAIARRHQLERSSSGSRACEVQRKHGRAIVQWSSAEHAKPESVTVDGTESESAREGHGSRAGDRREIW